MTPIEHQRLVSEQVHNECAGGPAYPLVIETGIDKGVRCFSISTGMSLRDWFAGMALQGMLASISSDAALISFQKLAVRTGIEEPELHATIAYRIADMMLKAREKE